VTRGADYESVADLKVHPALRRFVEEEVLKGAQLEPGAFWRDLAAIIADLAPRHRELLAIRDDLQVKIDDYHRGRKGQPHDAAGYEQFLRDIGYLVAAPAPDAYMVATKNVDPELAVVAGPQLVAPLSDAAAVQDAVNARWESLYDAITAAEGAQEDGSSDPARMNGVIAHVRAFLDRAFPLAGGSHADVVTYMVERSRLEVVLTDGSRRKLKSAGQFAGFTGPRHEPKSILLVNNGLHLELRIDRDHAVSKVDAAGIADVVMEAVPSVIMDLDDTVATADAEDKIAAYRNWQRLIDGSFHGKEQAASSSAAGDRVFNAPEGGSLVLRGRPIMLVRHVGHHVFTDAVLDGDGNPAPEAIIDAAVTVASALQDIRGKNAGRNSRFGSIYVIKPKMHGPDEVGLADLLFKRIEELVGLPKYTMKIGLMDEERRTSLNLAACMSRVRDRTFLLKTNVDERIGDEIRTSMEAGPMPRRAEMADAPWSLAYEANNVDTGIARNLPGRAQIGKGMATAERSAPGEERTVHARSGASSTGAPTPIAATRHAMHYHLVDAVNVQEGLRLRPRLQLGDLLAPSIAVRSYTPEEIEAELEGSLHYLFATVAPLVNRGAAASRAGVHAAGRHLANWLRHGVIDEEQVRGTMRRVAAAHDAPAFKAVESLIFKTGGAADAILPLYRREAKAGLA